VAWYGAVVKLWDLHFGQGFEGLWDLHFGQGFEGWRFWAAVGWDLNV
jgi:hypothetical protein